MTDSVKALLLGRINEAEHTEALRGIRNQMHGIMEAALPSLPTRQFYSELNELHDALVKRAIVLSEQALARMGKGSPPVPYVYLLFGSGGRMEQTLSSDQDSGLLYEDPSNSADAIDAKRYFQDLSEQIVAGLKQVGYPPCEGNVISTNPDWCKSFSEWSQKINGWFQEPHWEVVRYLLIVSDARAVYGDGTLLQRLFDVYYQNALDHPIIVRRMLDNTMRHKVLINVFGQLLKERYGEDAGSIDVKYGGYIPMVNAIRLMAIQAEMREPSTLGRIEELKRRELLSAPVAHAYREAFLTMMKLRLMTMEKAEDGYFSNNGKLDPKQMTKELAKELKNSLVTGKALQKQIFRQTMGKLR